MFRVLHLMGQSPDFQTLRSSNILAQKLGNGIDVTTRTIGPGGDDRNPVFAWFSLRRQFADGMALVHAWGAKAFLSAAAAGALRIIYSPTDFPSLRWPYAMRVAKARPTVQVVCSSTAEKSCYLQFGVPSERCHLIPPGVDDSRAANQRNPELRRALGFAEDDYVLLAPGESIRAAGHRDALWAASILNVLDARYRMLLWGRGDQAVYCERLAAKLKRPNFLALAEEKLGRRVRFDELLPAADAVLHTPIGPTPILPIAMCMGARLPIVSTPAPWLADILKDEESCMQVPRRSARMLAQRLMDLRDDAALASRISGAARKGAGDIFSNSGFIKGYRELYRKFA